MPVEVSGPVAANLTHWNGNALPAGAFSVRASSVQRGAIGISGVTSNTASVSSVTTTRAPLGYTGYKAQANDDNGPAHITLTNSTTVTAARQSGAGATTASYELPEYV